MFLNDIDIDFVYSFSAYCRKILAWLIEINVEITYVIFSTGSNSQKSAVNCIMGYQLLILIVEICEGV